MHNLFKSIPLRVALLFFLFFFPFFSTFLLAQDEYSLRVAYGKSTHSDLGEILYGDYEKDVANLYTYSFDGGKKVVQNLFDLPLDGYIKSSLSYFDEARGDAIYELTLYFKLYYSFQPFNQNIRLGFGEGGSYTTNILKTEAYGAWENNDNTSKFLNYLDISLDIDLGRLLRVKSLEKSYIGFLIKHRSGIFGLINNVKHGGSNYNCFMIEKNF
jgi:outer membrane protein